MVSVTVRGTIGHPRFDIDAWTVLNDRRLTNHVVRVGTAFVGWAMV